MMVGSDCPITVLLFIEMVDRSELSDVVVFTATAEKITRKFLVFCIGKFPKHNTCLLIVLLTSHQLGWYRLNDLWPVNSLKQTVSHTICNTEYGLLLRSVVEL